MYLQLQAGGKASLYLRGRRLSLGVLSHEHDGESQQQPDANERSYQGFRGTLCHLGGNLRYIPRRAYVVLNEAKMPLLCAISNPTPVDSLARLRYSGLLAQRRVRPSVVAVRSE